MVTSPDRTIGSQCILRTLAVCLLVTAAGCGDGRAQVRGRLTIDGNPAPAGLLLEFQPRSSNSSPSLARTDAAGAYELWQTSTKKGIVAGPSLVRISIAPVTADRGPPKLPPELEKLSIPVRYGSESSLAYELKPGPQTIDINIDLKP